MVKRAFLALFIVLFCSSLVLAAVPDDSLFDYSNLELTIMIRNDFDIVSPTNNYYIDSLVAEVSWFPRDSFRQDIHSLTADPEVNVNNDNLVFSWYEINKPSLSLEINSNLLTGGDFFKIKDKIMFPLNNLDKEYSKYLEPREITDVNDDIRLLAASIVGDEDDYYKAIFRIAEWVENNIEYDLSSATADASQKSSWVLENKQGVCDELTSLFISLCRSVGIPARFISGVSYSNINLENDGWGPHGWAEVYFPSIGWVPFDVTYKELGFIDATHIKLRESVDAGGASITYSIRSLDARVNPGSLDFEVDVVKKGPKNYPILDLKIDVLDDSVGFGSYNLVILEATNNKNYYVTSRLSLANVNNMELVGDNFQAVILAPGESIKVYWIVKVSSDLKQGFYYSFPVSVAGSSGELAETDFKVVQHSKTYSKSYVESLIAEKDYGVKYPITISCSPANYKAYVDDTVIITCSVKNDGDDLIAGLQACLEDDCKVAKLLPGSSEEFEFRRQFRTLGVKNLVFNVENQRVKENFYVVVSIQDVALINIEDVSIPEKIKFGEDGEIRFFVRKKSVSEPKNVNIKLEHKFFESEWNVDVMSNDHEFKTIFNGNNLFFDENEINIIVTYEDDNGKTLTAKKTVVVELEDPNFGETLLVLLYTAENYLEKVADGLADKIGNI